MRRHSPPMAAQAGHFEASARASSAGPRRARTWRMYRATRGRRRRSWQTWLHDHSKLTTPQAVAALRARWTGGAC